MVTRTKAYPNIAIPPGEFLLEEIQARGLTQKELARRMGRPINAINEIINGRKAITAETALQLEEVMPEIPARFWLNLETDFQLTKALVNKQTQTAASVREK
jgi:HTH-type transcriptional regulator / antitoxin HigA